MLTSAGLSEVLYSIATYITYTHSLSGLNGAIYVYCLLLNVWHLFNFNSFPIQIVNFTIFWEQLSSIYCVL